MIEKKPISGLADLKISEEIAKGTYSNLALLTHSQSEFIIDFALLLPGLKEPTVNSRILLTPEHAKRLLGALMDNINKYENKFGKIELEKGAAAPTTFSAGEA